jgi:uncharacterized membrane protein YidH (DUF202 family)
MGASIKKKSAVKHIAQAGLTSKGIVYSLLGVLAFLAAIEAGGQSTENADKSGVFNIVRDLPGGMVLLIILSTGLLCYSIWRGIQVKSEISNNKKNWPRILRYSFSAIIYLFVAYTAIRLGLDRSTENGDSKQHLAQKILSKPFGQWLLGIAAIGFASVGAYQFYYGLSEKYRKHVQTADLHSKNETLLLNAGKVGYISRGIVWLIIAYLMFQAAIQDRPSKAGDTRKAFQFLEDSPFGSFLLSVVAIGLIAYGVFNFIRAKYDRIM